MCIGLGAVIVCSMGPKRSSIVVKGVRSMRQTKIVQQTRADFFLTPRNANARDTPLQLEDSAARALAELSASGDVVIMERGECSAFGGGGGTLTPELPEKGLRRSARFSQSAGSLSLEVLGETGGGCPQPAESGASSATPPQRPRKEVLVNGPAGKGTRSDPQCVSPESSGGKKGQKKTKGRKKKADPCRSRKWQDSWAASFPWAEKHREEGEFVLAVKCVVCTRIEGRLRTLCCKRDNCNKHAGWYKATEDMPEQGVKCGEYWRDKNNRHYKNEKLFAALTKATVLEELNTHVEMNWSKKKCQFVVVLNMLLAGRPMTDYPSYRDVLSYLDCPLVPFKHWSVSSG
ncbi:hypothetical protein KC19_12G021500 [Ceratodon purpureus]|uniref:Uncharacterized protein n=1 Tax=Ceratodon purpureus TaxID=3225 RepID=A0A8T0G6R2_CERPU|nr:hypothetical protein KC19_12G021500 [Ceratodon purpureus]